MAENFRTSEVWYTLKAAFLTTIEYLMEAIRLNKAQCKHVIKPLLSIDFQKASITEKFSRVMK